MDDKQRKIINIIELACLTACICIITYLGLQFIRKSGQKTTSQDGTEEQSEEANMPFPNNMAAATGIQLLLDKTNAGNPNSSVDLVDEVDLPKKLIDMEDYESAPEDNGKPYYIKVNRSQNVVTVYVLDETGHYTVPVRAFLCSTGKNNATPTGTFRTSDKHDWSVLVGGVFGQYAYRIDGHIMFHSVPYYRRDKGSLESEEYNKLGTAASLGCVRLTVADAKWIYDNCPSGTLVTIYDSDYAGPLGKPAVDTIDVNDDKAGWDPTDMDGNNPWKTGDIRFFGCGERTVERGFAYDILAGITAYDAEGNDLTDKITVKTDCNIWRVGTYAVTYQIKLEDGTIAETIGSIQVKDSEKPEILTEPDYLVLNRYQATKVNWESCIRKQIQVFDAGIRLTDEHIQLIMDEPQQDVTQMDLTIVAIDDCGNYAEQTIPVYIDWNPPVIHSPKDTHIDGGTEDEIRKQLLEQIEVTDEGSGIADIQVTWTRHVSFQNYSVMVIAKDQYGNVATEFFDGFRIDEDFSE